MQPLDPLTLPLRGRMLIEASAGTGKTYTLALLVIRLLLERELAIDNILVVTFTTAATEELRGRIRLRIREALDVLRGEGPEDKTLTRLLAQTGKKDPAGAAVLLEEALTRMDEAAIFTIHGFCRRMLQEHAFESGAPFTMEFLENEQQLRMEIMEDFWRRRFYNGLEGEAAWAASLWKTPAGLYAGLGGHLGRPGVRCLPVIDDDEGERIYQRLLPLFAQIRQLWLKEKETITLLLKENKRLSRNNRTGYGMDRLTAAITAMDEFTGMDTMPWLLDPLFPLFARQTIDAALLQKNKHVAPPQHEFFDLVDNFHQLHSNMTNCRRISILLAAREYLHAELRRRKQENGLLYFDDLLLQMDAALTGKQAASFAGSISRRFPAILVDEFQDTDPLQYNIFTRIHKADKAATLFLIGDPKQAIYSFRGADIFTYLTARQATPENNRFTMTTNYRSTKPMVNAVNTLFNRDNPFLLDAGAMPFSPVEAAETADNHCLQINGRQAEPLTCLLLPEQESGKPLAKEAAGEQASRFCALEIAALLGMTQNSKPAKINGHPVSGGDIAVLVRTHREAQTMKNALRRLHIASVYHSKSSVFKTPEAGQMLTLLSCLLNPADAGLTKTLLATDLFGYDADRLEALRQDEQLWEEITLTLNRYREIRQQQGFLPMFYALLAGQHTVRRLSAKEDGERILTNFLHLAEILQDTARNLPGLEGLQRQLADCIERPDEQQEDTSQLRLESDENLVNIVTIHKAKGLEYPVVFLPFLWSARPCSPQKPFTFHQPHRPEQLCIDLGSGNDDFFRQAEKERLAADLRLLYVAVTRARYALFFCWGRVSKMEQTALCHLLHNGIAPAAEELITELARLHSDGAPLAVKPWTGETADRPPLTARPGPSLTVARFTGTIDTSQQITSYSGLTADHDPRPEQPDYDDGSNAQLQPPPGLNVFSFPKGPAAGTCLHAILERIDFIDPGEHEAIIADQLARAGFEQHWQQPVTNWIQAILATNLMPTFSLNQLAPKNRINEMGFSFPLKNMRISRVNQALASADIAPLPERQTTVQGLMVGFIDLIFRHRDQYFIVDYKSNYLGESPEDYRPEKLAAAMLEHRYDLQYLIYALALHRYLSARIPDYDYDRHFGGIFYLFLRGMDPCHPQGTGIFNAGPSLELITRLDRCCGGKGEES